MAYRTVVFTAACIAVDACRRCTDGGRIPREARFQLDFHVPDAALAAMLPAGFMPNVATQGPAKDANIRVIFVDAMTVNGPDGKPVGKGSRRFVYLARR